MNGKTAAAVAAASLMVFAFSDAGHVQAQGFDLKDGGTSTWRTELDKRLDKYMSGSKSKSKTSTTSKTASTTAGSAGSKGSKGKKLSLGKLGSNGKGSGSTRLRSLINKYLPR